MTMSFITKAEQVCNEWTVNITKRIRRILMMPEKDKKDPYNAREG